ncbi:MAG: PDDEXK nuclease domain-containing protein [Methanosarcinales archaeon]|nr:PDDEXK nuclease domain-containing protein [Methanosarcinales archaeon]
MNTNTNNSGQGPLIGNHPQNGDLFDRVAFILDQARANVVRSVNNQIVIAYWLIGREIVQAAQGGDECAEYGKKVLEELSARLSHRYGRGFSVTNLRYFRLFYQIYSERLPEIRHMTCDESGRLDGISQNHHMACDVLEDMSLAVQQSECMEGFSPVLSWSHYRTLTKVENRNERLFYEIETEKEGWTVEHLERQINTFLFARLLKSRDKVGLMKLTREGHNPKNPIDTIKEPYILDFLGLPDSDVLHESKLEKAIISNLQSFLLELGKGFAFVGRQKRLQFDDDFFYIDLVFYNCILKCYLLIDLKIGELTHQDVGQMDSYVRIFDDRYITSGDNPTIGLILCSKKNETIAKYSVLNNSKQLFASKYMLYLPTEEELKREIQHQRQLIEEGSKHEK